MAFLKAYLVVFGLFLPKTEKKIILIVNHKKKVKMWMRVGGWGSADVDDNKIV